MLHLVMNGKPERTGTKPGGFPGRVAECLRTLWLVSGARPGAVRQMRLVETLSLGGKKQLLLVACGGERFLVGTGADSVQTIVRIQAEMDAAANNPGAQGFEESL
jgi:flagellar biogenesis protein FliO